MAINLIQPEILESLKLDYPPGTRVELVRMDDPYTKLKPGDQGAVSTIDDVGTIFVNWDSGSRLGVVFGEDEIRKIKFLSMDVDARADYLISRMGKISLNKTIYRLTVADIICVMTDSDHQLDQLSNEQFKQLMKRLISKGAENIPWTEYLEASLDCYLSDIEM